MSDYIAPIIVGLSILFAGLLLSISDKLAEIAKAIRERK